MSILVSNFSALEKKLDKVWRSLPEYRNRNELLIKLLENGINTLLKEKKIKI